MTIPLWLVISVAVVAYLAGAGATHTLASAADDGPTFVPWLDTLIIALAIMLWPLTWAVLIVAAVLAFLARLMIP